MSVACENIYTEVSGFCGEKLIMCDRCERSVSVRKWCSRSENACVKYENDALCVGNIPCISTGRNFAKLHVIDFSNFA